MTEQEAKPKSNRDRNYFTLNLPMRYKAYVVEIAKRNRVNIYQVVTEALDCIYGVPPEIVPVVDGITVEDFGAVTVNDGADQ